jgi:hypothetical protein
MRGVGQYLVGVLEAFWTVSASASSVEPQVNSAMPFGNEIWIVSDAMRVLNRIDLIESTGYQIGGLKIK